MASLQTEVNQLTESSKIKDQTIEKLSKMLIKRENQFKKLFLQKNQEYQNIIKSKDHEILLINPA